MKLKDIAVTTDEKLERVVIQFGAVSDENFVIHLEKDKAQWLIEKLQKMVGFISSQPPKK